jgi:hypothetical protein
LQVVVEEEDIAILLVLEVLVVLVEVELEVVQVVQQYLELIRLVLAVVEQKIPDQQVQMVVPVSL